MAKSVRSKIKKRWRSLKRKYIDEVITNKSLEE